MRIAARLLSDELCVEVVPKVVPRLASLALLLLLLKLLLRHDPLNLGHLRHLAVHERGGGRQRALHVGDGVESLLADAFHHSDGIHENVAEAEAALLLRKQAAVQGSAAR